MLNKGLVSVLVNCYNSEAYLYQALDSLLSQEYVNFEVILIDNCSEDKTAEIAKSYQNLFGQRLKYIRTDKNIPLYAARNVGLKYVQGEFLAILDSDDYWTKDKLSLQISKMNNHSDIDIIYTAFQSYFESEKAKKYNFVKKLYLDLINFSDNNKREGFVSPDALIKNYNINFQTILFRTEKLKEFSFDDRYNLMGDLDFVFKLIWLRKTKIYFIPQVTATSRIHQRQLSRRSDLRWVIESIKVYRSLKTSMTDLESRLFYRYFVLFYYSSFLMRTGHFVKSLKLKSSYFFVSLRYSMHFFKNILFVIRNVFKPYFKE